MIIVRLPCAYRALTVCLPCGSRKNTRIVTATVFGRRPRAVLLRQFVGIILLRFALPVVLRHLPRLGRQL